MGSGASAGVVAATQAASDDELKAALSALSAEDRSKLMSALGDPKEKKEKKALKDYTEKEVAEVMKMFAHTDLDSDGTIDEAEFRNICQNILLMDPEEIDVAVADKIIKNGKLDKLEFFQWYTECSSDEAMKAFKNHAHFFAKGKTKELKQWSEEEVVSILKIFKDFDADKSGFIESNELATLCDLLCIDASVAEADLKDKDGKLGKAEFFAFYVGCDKDEAKKAWTDHAYLFAPKGNIKEWSEDEVTSVLAIFKQFDENNSGDIDEKELQSLCDILCCETPVAEKLAKEGKLSSHAFFAWYVGCSTEEADKVFEDHAALFKA